MMRSHARIGVALMYAATIGACLAGTSVAEAAVQPRKPSTTRPAPPRSNWKYSTDRDQLRGEVAQLAQTRSLNRLRFGFPYAGGLATLTVRKRPQDGVSVFLQVNGQFICSAIGDETVSVKFDDGPVAEYGCSESTSYTNGLIFLDAEDRFVAELKRAKKLIIEAEFYQEGPRQMQFNVSNFNWE